jgi:hypothetical protein
MKTELNSARIGQLIDYPFEVPRPPERENYINTIAQGIDDCYREILETVKGRLSDFAI